MQQRKFLASTAIRKQVPLLIGLVSPSGGGKTRSSLRLATGIQRVCGGMILGIDTEANRMLHHADAFKFQHIPFSAPFGSLDYLAALGYAITEGRKQSGRPIVIVDQISSEHDGQGGLLDYQEDELQRLAGDNYEKRERVKMLAWGKPKQARRALINGILQMDCNFIFNFRTKHTSKPVKSPGGKTEVVPQGFVPIAGEEFVYEMTMCAMLYPKADGYPTWDSEFPGEKMAMKLPEWFRPILLDERGQPRQLTEDIGEQLARWADGGQAQAATITLSKEWYAKCDHDQFDELEKLRAARWPTLNEAGRKALKADSDAAKARLGPRPTTPPAESKGDPQPDQEEPYKGRKRNPDYIEGVSLPEEEFIPE